MTTLGPCSYREITTQGASWRSALEAVLAQHEALQAILARNADRVHFFIGCGSTHYLAQYAAPFFQGLTGRAARGVPSSELYLQTETLVTPGKPPLVIALSRSGETSETVMAVETLRAQGSEAITISCYRQTSLAAISTLTVSIPEGQEESFAQTRSFAGMLVAAQALAALAAGDAALLEELSQLPMLAEGIIERAKPLAQAWGSDESIRRITYLGSGPLYGLANEATVKMKEMSLSMAEGYHFMEFRHGPMSLVDQEHLVVGLLSDELWPYEVAVLRDLKQRGARILVIANEEDGLAGEFDAVFTLQAPIAERARGVLYLPLVQLLAYYRAVGRGLNPDRPRHVVMAIKLQGTEMAPHA
jgi:glucosamine--fructose-6-phosphate aminotransferase (isomerizing)